MFVKICGLRSADDVAAAVEAGADAVGFVFHPKSVRDITPEAAASASVNAPGHIKRVAVMRHPANEAWQAVLSGFAPDVLQTDAEDFETLDVPEQVERWAVYREGSEVSGTGLFVYEGRQSGAGETVNWKRAAEIAQSGDMILAGGLDAEILGAQVFSLGKFGIAVLQDNLHLRAAENAAHYLGLEGRFDAANVGEAIATVGPYGVDVSSGVESAPGIKDATLIKEFVTAAKAAGRNL